MLALKQFEPKAWKEIKKLLRSAGMEVADLANSLEPKNAAGGIGTRVTDHGRYPGMKVYAKGGSKVGRDAAIFEFAGKPGTFTKTPQGKGMIRWLSRAYGSPGRFLWRAWGQKQELVMLKVQSIWSQAEAELQAAMARAGVE